MTIIEPIVPEVGKSYYCTVHGFTNAPVGHNVHLVQLKVEAIGVLTITVSSRDMGTDRDMLRRTYYNGDICFVEEVPAKQ